MSPRAPTLSDARIDGILELLMKLAAGLASDRW